MANICSNYMQITGPVEDIKELQQKILEQDPELLTLMEHLSQTKNDYGLWENTFTSDEGSITLSFGSKWNFPGMDDLVAAYPSLEFEVWYEEPGMQVYGHATGSNGKAIDTLLSPIDYYTEMNEDFAYERDTLKEMPYDEFIKYIIEEWTDDEDFIYGFLEEEIIGRIKDEDLPLFIDKKWYQDNTATLIINRLKRS